MKKAKNALHNLGSPVYAAKRATDIVFALQNKEHVSDEKLIGQVKEVLRTYGEQDPELSPSELNELKTVSQKLCTIFTAKDVNTTANLLNTLLRQYASTPRLSTHSKTPWHLHVDSSDHAPWAEWFAASSALALASLLAEKQYNPGGICASPSCGRPYIDLGKGGGRSYCSPRCATRERVAAYRKTKKSTTLPDSH